MKHLLFILLLVSYWIDLGNSSPLFYEDLDQDPEELLHDTEECETKLADLEEQLESKEEEVEIWIDRYLDFMESMPQDNDWSLVGELIESPESRLHDLSCESKLASLEKKLEIKEKDVKLWKGKPLDLIERFSIHPKFNKEWYPLAQDWVIKNFKKDSIERNRKLAKFTNYLEEIFVAKLKSLIHGAKYENKITPEFLLKLFKQGVVDMNQINQLLAFGSKQQQIYVEKIVQLYDLQPSFFGLTQSEFCEILGKCLE